MKKYFTLFAIFISLARISPAQKLAVGGNGSAFICPDSVLWTFGYNAEGELGNGSNSSSNIPYPAIGLTHLKAISVGGGHSIALKNDSTVWTWGYNGEGQLGLGNNSDTNTPVQVASLTQIVSIAAGTNHCFAIQSNGTVWCWGWGAFGQLGNGNNVDLNFPSTANTLTNVTAIAAGRFHGLALKSDSTLLSWGVNSDGALGNGNNNDSYYPVPVAITGVTAISAGWRHSLALKSDSTVWAWGYNSTGQLGDSTNIDSNIPIQVPALTGIIAIAAGFGHSLALKSDGTVWAWGYDGYGQLGNGYFFVDSYFPIQVTGLAGIIAIATGSSSNHSLALKNDGTVWGWGNGVEGELVNGSNVNNNIPIQITYLCSSVSVYENLHPLATSIFPNPSSGKFVFQSKNIFSPTEISITNILGEIIYQTVISNSNQEIDLSDQANGIYFVNARNEKGSFTQKIIIQK
ncbi:MAG: T9SS type A sorting domain-containing protein [Bacteroidetes bacterium]|nr:T9SS type A sorting domain-containing protein [Bacteroidota bacterium]